MGIPATDRTVTLSGIYIFRIAGGKIAEVWNLWDQLGELRQLGIVPETKQLIARSREPLTAT